MRNSRRIRTGTPVEANEDEDVLHWSKLDDATFTYAFIATNDDEKKKKNELDE